MSSSSSSSKLQLFLFSSHFSFLFFFFTWTTLEVWLVWERLNPPFYRGLLARCLSRCLSSTFVALCVFGTFLALSSSVLVGKRGARGGLNPGVWPPQVKRSKVELSEETFTNRQRVPAERSRCWDKARRVGGGKRRRETGGGASAVFARRTLRGPQGGKLVDMIQQKQNKKKRQMGDEWESEEEMGRRVWVSSYGEKQSEERWKELGLRLIIFLIINWLIWFIFFNGTFYQIFH